LVRRNSTAVRGGPEALANLVKTLDTEQHPDKQPTAWSSIESINALTWLEEETAVAAGYPAIAKAEPWADDEQLAALEDAVTALLRDTRNRPGDLHQTVVGKSTDRQPNPL